MHKTQTEFRVIYDAFLSKTTDDMYMELSREDTEKMLFKLFEGALPRFEFPRKNIFDYDVEAGRYNIQLSREEIDIIATYMIDEWIGYQLASVENTRMKYSGSDFKFTSQANHMQKLLQLKKDYERLGFHLQRLYKRRIQDDKGIFRSTMGQIMQPISYKLTSNESNNGDSSTGSKDDCEINWGPIPEDQ